MEKVMLYIAEYSFKAGIFVGMLIGFVIMLIGIGIIEALKYFN